ncbi:hypothetical protein OnM2_026088 [Erysiphe neolycopersici]|uniref:Uncharacterized protein n=1 Tax=Erysiphe neolycopersici TaxID=212602 RepID=A0A420I0N8_9PEZI|nr:hypothetical protein OnM2_026088 [Erysiphe neolycopersici]
MKHYDDYSLYDRILGLQNDDTLFLGNTEFANQLKKAEIIAKPLEKLSGNNPLILFDGYEFKLPPKKETGRLTTVS